MTIGIDDWREKEDRKRKRLLRENQDLLRSFREWLCEKKLSEKTVVRHMANVNFYVNKYLISEGPFSPMEGSDDAIEFLGEWLIRKASWTREGTIRSFVLSIKKLFTFMHEKCLVEDIDLEDVKETTKEMLPEWIEELKALMEEEE